MLKKLFLLFFVVACGLVALLLLAGDSYFEVKTSRTIAQPVEQVWAVLADVEDWPTWWPGFEEAILHEPRQIGSEIELKLVGVPAVPAQLSEFKPNEQLAWQQQGFFGSVATTSLQLVAQADGSEVTLVHAVSGPQAKLAEFGNREEFVEYQQLFLQALELHLQPATGEKD